MKWVVIIPLLLVCSCSLFGKRSGHEDWGEPTPAGFRVQYEDQGSVSTGRLTKHKILELFDVAQTKAKREFTTRYGVAPQTYDAYARGSKYLLMDNKNFPTDASSTGYASGMVIGSHVWVALYTRPTPVFSQDQIPISAPPWTVVKLTTLEGVTKWSYGVLNSANPFPALTHELGHRILPGKFEHEP